MKGRIIILFALLPGCLFAQKQGQPLIDSLEEAVKNHVDDTSSVETLLNLAGLTYLEAPGRAEQYCLRAKELAVSRRFYRGEVNAWGWLAYLSEQQGKIDSALNYNQKAIELSRQYGFKKELALCYNNVAAIYKDQGKISEALNFYDKSLQLNTEIGNKKVIGSSCNNIGLLYLNLGQVQEALAYFHKSLRIGEEVDDKEGMATAIYNIATLYKEQGHYPEALDYLQKSLKINTGLKDKYSIAYDINFMGAIYEKQGYRDKALEHFTRAYQLRAGIDDKQGMAYSLRNIGSLYESMDSAAAALNCYLKGLELMKQADDKSGTASLLNRLGNFHLKNGNLPDAKRYADQNIALALDLKFPESIRDAAQLLDRIYRREGNWKQALDMSDLYLRMRDSVQNAENRNAALRDKFKYEYEKKELAMQKEQEKKDAVNAGKLKQQRILMNAYLGSLALACLLLLAIYNRYRLKTKANIAITREKQRSDELLKNILPELVAEELKANGNSEARQFEKVTVLFTDFVSFTTVAERLPPKTLVDELNNCFKAFDFILEKYRVEKIKTVGDAYIAVAGLPVEDAEHAENIVQAAIEIRDFMRNRKSDLGEASFDIRLGIHSGSVVAGIVGVKKFAYDIWGDTVNTAARLEQHSAPGMINLSSATYELVKDKHTFEYRGKVEAKNKGYIDMYFLI